MTCLACVFTTVAFSFIYFENIKIFVLLYGSYTPPLVVYGSLRPLLGLILIPSLCAFILAYLGVCFVFASCPYGSWLFESLLVESSWIEFQLPVDLVN